MGPIVSQYARRAGGEFLERRRVSSGSVPVLAVECGGRGRNGGSGGSGVTPLLTVRLRLRGPTDTDTGERPSPSSGGQMGGEGSVRQQTRSSY